MAVTWRVARSLDVLLGQLNARAPNRNKASDGSIGDADHQNRSSDHNPWYGPGIVTARDFTHDPGDLDCQWLANTLTDHRDPRIKYIIWNRRIWNPAVGWRAYTGANPHTSHLHLSVVASPACDSTAAWAGISAAAPPPPPPPEEVDELALDDSMSPYVWPYTADSTANMGGKDKAGHFLADARGEAIRGANTSARVEAKLDAMAGTLTNNQAALLAAISDEETQITLSPEQMELFLNGVEDASARGLFEALKQRYEPTP